MHIRKKWLGLHGKCTGFLHAIVAFCQTSKLAKTTRNHKACWRSKTPWQITNANSMKCKRSIDKHCRGNVLCRSVTDCKRNHIMLKMQACGLQPMLLTPRNIKLACIFCIYALALEAGPRRWKICPPLPACAPYGWIKTWNQKNDEAGNINFLHMSREIIGNVAKPQTKSDMSWMTYRTNRISPVDVFVLLCVEWLLAAGLSRWRCWKFTKTLLEMTPPYNNSKN